MPKPRLFPRVPAAASVMILLACLAGGPEAGLGRARAAAADGQEPIARAMAGVAGAVATAAADPARPMLHFRPPAQWMNDPNGLIQHRGIYHVFYQHNPYGDGWGNMHWGHARSRNLVHWEHLPVALWPSKELAEDHVFSGCTTLNGRGEPVAFYTSIGRGKPAEDAAEQWMAVGSPDLVHWTKHPGNPVLAEALHGGTRIWDWRDPFIVQSGRRTFLVCGGNLDRRAGGGAVVLLYESRNADLTAWTYRGVLFRHPDPEVKNVECPLLFKRDDTWVLVLSPHRRVEWFTGTFDADAGTFAARRRGLMDYGDAYYAPNTFTDETGRQVVLGWVRGFPEGRGWNGCLTLPRVVTVSGGVLRQVAAPEIESLRGARQHLGSRRLAGDFVWPEVAGDTLEFDVALSRGGASSVGVRVLRSADGGRAVNIDWNGQRLEVAGASMSLFGDLTGDRVEFRVILDRSVVEVYAAGQCLTRVVPFDPANRGVSLYANGDGARISSVTAWSLKPVW